MQLLQLRYFQYKRDLGWWFLIIAALVFYVTLSFSEGNPSRGLLVCGGIVLGLFSFHGQRRDLRFIRFYFERPLLQVVLVYQVLILPASLALAFNFQWLAVLALHGLVTLVCFVPSSLAPRKYLFLQRFVPAAQFEWLSGLRKNLMLVILLLAVAIFLSPVKLFGVAALFVLNSVLLSFYGISEPRVMLNPEYLEPEEFLRRKIRFLNRVLLWINVPLLLVNALVFPESAWFAALFLAAMLLVGSCMIYLKYANYQPNAPLGFHIDQVVLFAGLVLPYLLPLAVIIYFSNKKKAILRLQHLQTP